MEHSWPPSGYGSYVKTGKLARTSAKTSLSLHSHQNLMRKKKFQAIIFVVVEFAFNRGALKSRLHLKTYALDGTGAIAAKMPITSMH